ncbi:MAG: diguanylate cyclase [Gallionella sp.]|jgi:diguanylate cyclase (GGDEF)-like protein/PAS domain S-box-containing protein|nr:diguanylate cyclase [Gallionella sp.]
MMNNAPCRILLVEDEESDASLLRQSMKSAPTFTFDWVTSMAQAQQYLQKNVPDVVLLDLTLPDSSGLQTVQDGRRAAVSLPLIVLTGHNDPEFALQTLESGAQDYLVKGEFCADDLIRSIRYAMSRAKLEQRLIEAEERWRFALEGAGDGVWDWNVQTNEVKFSVRLKEMLGYADDEIADHLDEWMRRIHPEDLPKVQADVAAYFAGALPAYFNEHRLLCKDGRWKWILDRGRVVSFDAAGEPLRMIGTHTDIDMLKQAEEMLSLSSTVFNTVDEAILVCDADNRIVMVNPAFTRVTGYQAKEVMGKNPQLLSSGKHNADFYRQLWAQLTCAGSWCGELWNRRKSGELYVEWSTIKQVRDPHGKLTHYVAAFSDITLRKADEENIRHQAQHDALTDLPNRVLLIDRLRQALSLAKRDKMHLALMYLDLDQFKPVNDTLGHAVGDLLLQEVAARIRSCVREADTVARMGGDEFVVLLTSSEDQRDALTVAEKIRVALEQVFHISGASLQISSSLGIAVYPEHGASEHELLEHADIAMYYAKQSGRNQVRLYEPEMIPGQDK